VPEKRIDLVRSEMIRRCNDRNISTDKEPITKNGVWSTKLNISSKYLAVTNWGLVLDFIRADLKQQGENDTIADIVQLQGFCEYVDSTAFLPLLPSETDSSIGGRIIQYIGFIDKLIKKLKDEKILRTWRNVSDTMRSYGKYLQVLDISGIGQNYVILEVNLEYWGKYAATPIWFGVMGTDWKYSSSARQKLRGLEDTKHVQFFDLGERIYSPLYLKPGVEEQEVINDLFEQVKQIADCLNA